MTNDLTTQAGQETRKGFSGLQVLGMVVASMCITIIVTIFAVKMFLFPAPLKPVVLSDKEEQQLATKLDIFEGFNSPPQPKTVEQTGKGSLEPEKYSEEGTSREINFTEREINAMLAKNTDLADKLAVDLAEDMISIKLLIPLAPDFPILGGQTLKVKAGAELAYRQGRPVVKLKGVSLMGVPVPNAWLGGIKNIDLIREFGSDEGIWKNFADGIDSIRVVDGFLNIQLKK